MQFSPTTHIMPNRQNITQHKESSHQLLAKANPMCEENSQHFLLQFYPLNSAQLKNVLEPEKILRNSFHTARFLHSFIHEKRITAATSFV
jgi:hypothetical protein